MSAILSFLTAAARFPGEAFLMLSNLGLMMSLSFGMLILLRPVTNRLVRPQHRVWIWLLGCIFSLYPFAAELAGRIPLPVSFRIWAAPRVWGSSTYGTLPLFFPAGSPEPTLVLPGGGELPFRISLPLLGLAALVWLAVLILLLIQTGREEKRLKQLGLRGEIVPHSELKGHDLLFEHTVVRRCKGLPTSFVRRGQDEEQLKSSFVIYLQDELPRERQDLILLHELLHIELRHTYLKSLLVAVVYIFWWNPLIWLAYRFVCRDMELACDDAVMARLSPEDRRSYARAIVELGAGQVLWTSVACFGECDTQIRVRRLVKWRPPTASRTVLSVLCALLLLLFLFCGSAAAPERVIRRNWIDFASSPALERAVEEYAPELEIDQVWGSSFDSETEKYLLLRDSAGDWYGCEFRQEEGQFFLQSIHPGFGPKVPDYFLLRD